MSLAMSSFPFSSEAQIAPETDAECEIVNEEAICEGDLSEGVVANFAGPSFNTLTIQNVTGPIAPAAGVGGVVFISDTTAVNINVEDGVIINTDNSTDEGGMGIFGQTQTGDINITSGAEINTDGGSFSAIGILGLSTSDLGDVTIDNSGDITVTTSAQRSGGISGQRLTEGGSVTVTNTGDITATSTSVGERDEALSAIGASSAVGADEIEVINDGVLRIQTAAGNTDTDLAGAAAAILTNNFDSNGTTSILNTNMIFTNGPGADGIVGVISSADDAGADLLITNQGDITLDGEGSFGIVGNSLGGSSNISINNTASISASNGGNSGGGIFGFATSEGEPDIGITNFDIQNSGTITGDGEFDIGIRISDQGNLSESEVNSVIENTGEITLSGNGRGISVETQTAETVDAVINNSGDISLANTSGNTSNAIFVRTGVGDNFDATATINNSGNLNVANSNVISIGANNAIVNNDGNINATGENTFGIFATLTEDGQSLSVNNTGSFTSSEGTGGGILGFVSSEGSADIDVTNSGTISGSGSFDWGIRVIDNGSTESAEINSTLTNDGDILLAESGRGIAVEALIAGTVNSVISNTGTITLDNIGNFSSGAIYVENSVGDGFDTSTTIDNSGDLLVTGANAVFVSTNQADITNSGVIESDVLAIDIVNGGETETHNITNSGTIRSTGSFAVRLDSGAVTLTNETDGLIEGAFGGITIDNAIDTDVEITNAGTINALGNDVSPTGTAVFVTNGTVELTNSGEIDTRAEATGDLGTAINTTTSTTANGEDQVTNENGGSIFGTIFLGDANDSLALHNGSTQDGLISLGAGDDQFELGVLGTVDTGSTATFGDVDLGAGDDIARINTFEFSEFTINGGTETDTFSLVDTGSTASSVIDLNLNPLNITNFEQFTSDETGTFFVTENGSAFNEVLTNNGNYVVNSDLSGTSFTLNNGTFAGTGILGDLSTIGQSFLRPGGLSVAGDGSLSSMIGSLTTGNLNLGAGTIFEVQVNDQGQSDQLFVNGSVSIVDSILNVLDADGGAFDGQTVFDYIIIDNDGADAVDGVFSDILNELAFLTPTVSYVGGDGNDVILTLTVNNSTTPPPVDPPPMDVMGCNPDPAMSGEDVLCTGVDSDGFSVDPSIENVNVLVEEGATVTNTALDALSSTVIGLFGDVNAGTLTNQGSIELNFPDRDQVTGVQVLNDGNVINDETGIIDVSGGELNGIVRIGSNGSFINRGIIRGEFFRSSDGVSLFENNSFLNEEGGLIEVFVVDDGSFSAGGDVSAVRSSSGGSTIINEGVIRISPEDDGTGFRLTGIESTFGDTPSLIINGETGVIEANGEAVIEGIVANHSDIVQNNGEIRVSSTNEAGTESDPSFVLGSRGIRFSRNFNSDGSPGELVNTGLVSVTGNSSIGVELSDGVNFTNTGQVLSNGAGFVAGDAAGESVLGEFGEMLQGSPGVLLVGGGSSEIVNEGLIQASGENSSAIVIGAQSTDIPVGPNDVLISNTGEIRGTSGGITGFGDTDETQFTIANGADGTIEATAADGVGVSVEGAILALDTAGTVTGTGGTAISSGDQADGVIIRDTGVVNGDILLSGGDDVLTTESGASIIGSIDLGDGSDIVSLADGTSITGDILFGAGDDTYLAETSLDLDGQIFLGDDNDVIELISLDFGETVDGGSGSDTARFIGDGSVSDRDFDLMSLDFSNIETFSQDAGDVSVTLLGDGSVFNTYDLVQGASIVSGEFSDLLFTSQAGTTLSGSGTVGDLNLFGTLAPGTGIGTFTVGNYINFGEGSIFEVEVNDDGTSDQLAVFGSVTIDTGSTLSVLDANGGAFDSSDAFNFIIIDNQGAGNIDGMFDTITNELAFLTPSVTYDAGDGNDVGLTLTVNNTAPPPPPVVEDEPEEPVDTGPLFPTAAQTFNQFESATSLDNFEQTAGTDTSEVFGTILFLTNAQAPLAFDAASGEIYTALTAHQTNSGQLNSSNSFSRAFQPLGEGVSAWVGGTVGDASIDTDGNGAEIDGSTTRFQLGLDYRANESKFGAGARFSFLDQSVEVEDRSSIAEGDGWALDGYARYGTSGSGVTLAASANISEVEYDVARQIVIDDLSRIANSSVDLDAYGFEAEARYGFDVGENWSVGPVASISYSDAEIGAFSETGAESLNLLSAGNDADRVWTGIGVFSNWQSESANIDVSARYLAGESQFSEATLAFEGNADQPFEVRSPRTNGEALSLDASGSIVLGEGWRIGASLNGVTGGDVSALSARAAISLDF